MEFNIKFQFDKINFSLKNKHKNNIKKNFNIFSKTEDNEKLKFYFMIMK